MSDNQNPEQEVNYDWEMRSEDMPFQNHMIAGCAAGLIEHSFMLPFDTIKTHQQVSKKASVLQVAKHIYKQGGFQNFYQGWRVVASGTMPAHAAFFSIYEVAKLKFNINDDNLHPYEFALTGCLATFFHDLIMTPIDVIKQRQQLTRQKSTEIYNSIKLHEGKKAFLRSFKITYLMNVPQAAILVSVNESLKVISFARDQHNFLSHLACAGIAGGIASFLTTPLDVIKTRLQTQKSDIFNKSQKIQSNNLSTSNTKNLNPKPQYAQCSVNEPQQYVKYINGKQTINSIIQEEGYLGFFRGAGTRMLMVAPSAAISWACYEQLKKILLKNYNEKNNNSNNNQIQSKFE